MKILSLDSATEACSVALYIDGEVTEDFRIAKNQHSSLLLDMVDNLLASTDTKLSGVNVIAYDQGPGSFTGVRIGAGVAQGLGLSADLPVIGVSSLFAMSQTCPDGLVLPAIDARMGQVYWSLIEKNGDIIKVIIDESVDEPDVVVAEVSKVVDEGMRFSALGTGWNSYPEISKQLQHHSVTMSSDCDFPRASSIAKLAAVNLLEGNLNRQMPDMPRYIRDKVTN